MAMACEIITFWCLSSLVTWAKNIHQLLKFSRSSESSDVDIPSLSSIVHTVIRKIDTFGSGTSSSEGDILLKTTLPQFCHLNRAVRRALTQYTSSVPLKYFTVAFTPRVVLY